MTRWVGGDLWTRPPVQKGTAVAALTVALLGAFYVSQATTTKAPALVTLAIAGILFGAVVAMSRRDAVSLLTIVLVPLFLVPENYSIAGPLKSVGYPAAAGGPGLSGRVGRWRAGRARSGRSRSIPFRWAMLASSVTSLTAFAAGAHSQPGPGGGRLGDATIFPVLAMIGIAMLAADGLTRSGRWRGCSRRLVDALPRSRASAGALEFFLNIEYDAPRPAAGARRQHRGRNAVRSGIERIEAAAAHPIEFSLALATAVPLALHFALNAESQRSRRLLSGSRFAMLAGVVPLTVSRTGSARDRDLPRRLRRGAQGPRTGEPLRVLGARARRFPGHRAGSPRDDQELRLRRDQRRQHHGPAWTTTP